MAVVFDSVDVDPAGRGLMVMGMLASSRMSSVSERSVGKMVWMAEGSRMVQ